MKPLILSSCHEQLTQYS